MSGFADMFVVSVENVMAWICVYRLLPSLWTTGAIHQPPWLWQGERPVNQGNTTKNTRLSEPQYRILLESAFTPGHHFSLDQGSAVWSRWWSGGCFTPVILIWIKVKKVWIKRVRCERWETKTVKLWARQLNKLTMKLSKSEGSCRFLWILYRFITTNNTFHIVSLFSHCQKILVFNAKMPQRQTLWKGPQHRLSYIKPLCPWHQHKRPSFALHPPFVFIHYNVKQIKHTTVAWTMSRWDNVFQKQRKQCVVYDLMLRSQVFKPIQVHNFFIIYKFKNVLPSECWFYPHRANGCGAYVHKS